MKKKRRRKSRGKKSARKIRRSSKPKTRKAGLWARLRKAWKGYRIAKAKNEPDKAHRYACVINDTQAALGLEMTELPESLDYRGELRMEMRQR